MNLNLSLRKSTALDFLFAVIQRLAVIGGLFWISSQLFNLQTIAQLRDGEAYLNLARGLLRGSFAGIDLGDTQYFIGYPLCLSFFLRFLPPWVAAYLIQFLCLAGSLSLGRKLFGNPWIMRWVTLCIPSYVFFTSLNMSEALILVLIFAIIDAYLNQRFMICSILLGYALITRPQSMIFLYFVLLLNTFTLRRFSKLLLLTFIPASFCAGMLFFNHAFFGDYFHNYHIYGVQEPSRSLISIPFKGYVVQSFNITIRAANKIYVWGFTAFIFAGLLLLWNRSRRGNLSAAEKIFLHWGTLQFLFFVSLNSRWGFMELPRYFIPLFPSALLGYYEKVPKTWIWVIIAAALSIAFSIYIESSGNGNG